jgi:integrase/recombinase XerD
VAYLKSRKNKIGKTYYASVISKFKESGKYIVISLGTSDYDDALDRHQEVEDKESAIKRGKIVEWSWKSERGKTRIVKMSLRDLVSKWIELKKINVREGTWKRYVISLNAFMNAVGKGISPNSINNDTIEGFKKFYNGVHKVGGININLRGIKCFLKWAYEEGYIKKMPKVKQLKIGNSKPKIINDANWDRLMKLNSLTDYWKDLFKLYRDTGMRRAEGVYGVLDGSFLTIDAEDTKSGMEKDVKLTTEQIEVVKTMHLARDKYLKKGYTMENFLNNISKRFKEATTELELDLTFHSLRHTFATRKWLETEDIYLVCKLMGHSSVTTTEIYTTFQIHKLEQEYPSLIKKPLQLVDLDTPIMDTQTIYHNNSLR